MSPSITIWGLKIPKNGSYCSNPSMKALFQFSREKWRVASEDRLFEVVFSKSPLDIKPRHKAYERGTTYRTASQILWLLHNIHLKTSEDYSRMYIREQNNEKLCSTSYKNICCNVKTNVIAFAVHMYGAQEGGVVFWPKSGILTVEGAFPVFNRKMTCRFRRSLIRSRLF